MNSHEAPRQRFFREEQRGGAYTPLSSSAARAGMPPDGPDRRARVAGCVIILPPGRRRSWTAAWSEQPDGEFLDMFDADTLEEALAWSFGQTAEVFIRQATGELVRAERPDVTEQ